METRRIVTGHDSNGNAIFVSDSTLTGCDPTRDDGTPPAGVMPGFTTIFRTDGLPAVVGAGNAFADYHGKMIPLADSSGVVCRITDFPAVGDAPETLNIMHRTQSIDFGVVLSGEIMLILDNDKKRLCRQGDVVVQRATIHAWKNVSKENCRMLFVLVPSDPVKNETTGELLEPTPTLHLQSNPPAEPVIVKAE